MRHEKNFVSFAPTRIDTPVSAHLRRGLTKLEVGGWCKSRCFEGPRMCAGAAIFDGHLGPVYEAAMSTLVGVIRERYGDQWSVSAWNDQPERTFEEVRWAYCEAIELANR